MEKMKISNENLHKFIIDLGWSCYHSRLGKYRYRWRKRMSERKEPQNIIIFGSYDTDIVLIINKKKAFMIYVMNIFHEEKKSKCQLWSIFWLILASETTTIVQQWFIGKYWIKKKLKFHFHVLNQDLFTEIQNRIHSRMSWN